MKLYNMQNLLFRLLLIVKHVLRLFISFVIFCAIFYHLYNSTNVKNTRGGVILFVASNFAKSNAVHGCFSRFLNCTNGTKSQNASHLYLMTFASTRYNPSSVI